MKILITSDLNTYSVNGVITSINNLMYGLRARGHEVKLLTLSPNHETRVTEDGWEVASLPAGIVYPGVRVRVGLMNKVYDKVIDWNPDIIHSQCEMSTFIMAHHIAHECDVPIVHTYHTVYEDYTHYVVKGHLFPEQQNKMARQAVAEFSKIISTLCGAMIAPTDKVKEMLEGYDCKCPLYVIPTGIDLTRFSQQISASERTEMRGKYGFTDEDIVAVYLGRVAAEKNIDEVIEYISKAPENVKLLVTGGGPKLDDLVSLVNKKNYNDRVSFVGMVNPSDVWKYYKLGDLFTSASTSETQGLTYIEALSSGLPLLCRKDQCLDGVVIDKVNGCMFENEQEFGDGLETIINIIGDEAYNRDDIAKTAEKFSRECFAASCESLYLDTIKTYSRKSISETAKENIQAALNRLTELSRRHIEYVKEPINKLKTNLNEIFEEFEFSNNSSDDSKDK